MFKRKTKKTKKTNKIIGVIEEFDVKIKRVGYSKIITLPPNLINKHKWKVGNILSIAILKRK